MAPKRGLLQELLVICYTEPDRLDPRSPETCVRERGMTVDHTTILRWVQRFAPELDKRCRPQLNAMDSPIVA